MTPIANRLKAEIENKGISYSSTSRKTNIPVNTISRSLMGKRKLLADELILICRASDIELGELCEYKKKPLHKLYGKELITWLRKIQLM